MLLLLISILSLPSSLVVGSTEIVSYTLLLHRILSVSFELVQLPSWFTYVVFSYPQPSVGVVFCLEFVELVFVLFLFVFELVNVLFLS